VAIPFTRPSRQAFTPVLNCLDGPFIIWIRLATGKAANSEGNPAYLTAF